ncbi:MAG: ABC transporter permease, partial [Silvibacterium sp.]
MLFSRNRETERLNAELEFHIEQQTTENVAAGMSPEEARYAALRAFGNPTLLREQTKQNWSWSSMESLIRDLRYGVRTLARTPGFSFIVILVMALGTGATIAMFTVVHSILLNPLPYKNPNRLVRIYEDSGEYHKIFVSGADFVDWRRQEKDSFQQMAVVFWNSYDLSGTAGQLPEQVLAQTASWNAFPMLGVKAALGRLFDAGDDRPDANAVVVLSWGLWKRRYGGDRGIIGQTIQLDAKPYTVIGVLPAWFNFPNPKVQLWTPFFHEVLPKMLQSHGAHNFEVFARLKPGVSIAQAQAEMSSIQTGIRKRFPDGPVFSATRILPLLESRVGEIRSALYMLLAATGCLLLIACLNVANLLVARSVARRREAAIRTALGGGRARLIREQLVESILLCLTGGAFGLLMAALAIHWVVSMRPDIPRANEIHLDGIAVLVSLGIMLLCGFIAGLIPALSLKENQILRTLQQSARSQSGGQDRARLRRTLLSLEVALTVVLLVGASLLLKSYEHLRSVDLGCDTHNVLTMGINLPEATFKTPIAVANFYDDLLQRVRVLPGVKAGGATTTLPGNGHGSDHDFLIPENPPPLQGQFLDALVRSVDPGFFQAMQIPLIRGRFFQPNERESQAQFAIVSQSFVRKFFPHADPIGKQINDDNFAPPHNFEIIGVVADVRQNVAADVEPTIYFPLLLGEDSTASLAVVTRSNPLNFALPVQKIIAQMDPNLAVSDILTMDQIIGNTTLDASFEATLLTIFAIISLVLAAVGLFGVLSYIATQRQGEIGIRIALGAQREQVLRRMLMDGLKPAVLGLVLGLIASAATVRLIRSLLYGTQPLDFTVFVLV